MERSYFPVTWVLGKIGRRRWWLGYCGKTRMLWYLTQQQLLPVILNDILIREDRCEEGEGCLASDCPLNRTTAESFWKRHGIQGHPPKNAKTISGLRNVRLPDDIEAKGGLVMAQGAKPLIELLPGPGRDAPIQCIGEQVN